MSTRNVRVGVGVLVKDPKNPGNVFAGLRKGSHGSGTLALPGGHLEMYESWEQCASREVKEEMGVDICNIRFGHCTNDPMESEHKHYVTIFMMGEFVDSAAVPVNCEPHKCLGWRSYSWTELEEILVRQGSDASFNLFGPLLHLVQEKPEKVLEFLMNGKR